MTIESDDTYETAYYVMSGAKIVSARERRIRGKNAIKIGAPFIWIATLEDVSQECIDLWKSKKARANLIAFKDARLKVKKKVKKLLNIL